MNALLAYYKTFFVTCFLACIASLNLTIMMIEVLFWPFYCAYISLKIKAHAISSLYLRATTHKTVVCFNEAVKIFKTAPKEFHYQQKNYKITYACNTIINCECICEKYCAIGLIGVEIT